MKFDITSRDTLTRARAGLLTTAHGSIETPIFMPVGTAGSVKAVHIRELNEDIKAQIILGNTYHLYLRPGLNILEKAGGLHQFNGWSKPILTDSGGYQVFSLAARRKIKEEGVHFQSHIDGSRHFLSPEVSMDIQRIIGADIIMAFDECTPYPCEYGYAKKSMEMTHRWLQRCCKRISDTSSHYGYEQSLFGIIQGSVYQDLRTESAKQVTDTPCKGFAIGGLSVGEPHELMYEITAHTTALMPEDKPRYLMGVGTPANILECIALGIDMFDCVMPTRNARNAMLFTKEGIINIDNNKWKDDFSPIDENGYTYVDTAYSKAYLRHLFVSGEMLGPMIASVHNLGFYLWLVAEARRQIMNGTFNSWKKYMTESTQKRL